MGSRVTQVSLKWCFQGTVRAIPARVNFCERWNSDKDGGVDKAQSVEGVA